VTFKDHVLFIKDGLYVDGPKFLVLCITKPQIQHIKLQTLLVPGGFVFYSTHITGLVKQGSITKIL